MVVVWLLTHNDRVAFVTNQENVGFIGSVNGRAPSRIKGGNGGNRAIFRVRACFRGARMESSIYLIPDTSERCGDVNYSDEASATYGRHTWPRGEGSRPFYTWRLWKRIRACVSGLRKDLRPALVSVFSRLRRFRLFVFSSSFGGGFGRLAVAAVSCLVVRVRHTSTTLLN